MSKNDVEFGGDVSQGYESPFDIVSTKSASVESLKRWRQAALLVNASRRFRYTLDLKREEEKKQFRAKIKTHMKAIREAYLSQAAGAQPNGTGPSSCLYTDHQKIEMLRNKMFLERPTVPSSDESRYLTDLWVSGNVKPRGVLCQHDPSPSIATGFKLWEDSLYYQETTRKIRGALKLLALREQHVLVQFWAPRAVGKHQLLTTIDQPFGLGEVSEQSCFYRRDSEHKSFLVDKDHEEKDHSPPARVFRRGLPEWTSDVANYTTKDFAQRDCAIRCNFHGYLALPVFDSTTRLCVGVLELITSSKYADYAFEVRQVSRALKNLKSPNVLEDASFYARVGDEKRQLELDGIFRALKTVCDTHNLPLAQTWDVSKLGEDEYPLVAYARMHGITSCLGIYLKSPEADGEYVIELFLPTQSKDEATLQSLVKTVKQHITNTSSIQLGDLSSLQFIGGTPPLTWNLESPTLTEKSQEPAKIVEKPVKKRKRTDRSLSLEVSSKYYGKSMEEAADNLHGTGPSCRLYTDQNIKMMSDKIFLEHPAVPSSANVPNQWPSTNVSMESICDNFTFTIDTVEISNLVTVDVTFNGSAEQFTFPRFAGLVALVNEVAKRFKQEGQGLRLKYIDEDNDLIVICVDEDLKLALDTLGSNNSITLIYGETGL